MPDRADFSWFSGSARHDHHAFDELTEERKHGRFRHRFRLQDVLKVADVLREAADGLRMELDRLRRLCGKGELRLGGLAFPAQSGDARPGILLGQRAVGDGIHQAGEGGRSLGMAALDQNAPLARCRGHQLAFLAIGLDIGPHEIDVSQRLCEARKRCPLDLLDIVAGAVAAGTAFPMRRAHDAMPGAIAADRRHAAAASAAAQETRKQPRRLPAARRLRAVRLLAGERWRSDVVGDDAQMRCRGPVLGILAIGPRDAPSRLRIANHGDAIPHDLAAIKRVLQDPRSTLPRAVDGRGIPAHAARRRHALGIERARDGARRGPAGIGHEDAPHDLGLGLDDLELAGPARRRPIAIGPPAGVAAVADDAGHAAPHLQDVVLAEHLADQAAKADCQRIGLAFVHGDDVDAREPQPLMQRRQILHVAGDTIQGLDDQNIEALLAGRFHQRDEAFAAEDRRPGTGAIGIIADDRQPVAGGIGVAERLLILDRAITLQLG